MSVVNFLFLILKIKEGILIANANTIINVVTEVVAPAIKEPFELVDVEYEKMGSDYVLSILLTNQKELR